MKWNAIGLVVAVLVFASAALADEKPTIDDVKKAWKARQEANKSFRIEWVETVKVKAGAYGTDGYSNPGPHPPEDIELKAVRSFAANGDMAAAAGEQAAYQPTKQSFVPFANSEHFDGTTGVRIMSLSQPGWVRVNIESGEKRISGLNSTSNEAVTRLYRPLGGGAFAAFEFEGFKLFTGEKIGTVACVELRKTTNGFRYSIWCDPKQEFRPVRHSWQDEGGEGRVLDWTYQKGEKERWTPSGWESKRVDKGGTTTQATKAEVKKLDLAPKFAAEAFAPKARPGSHVNEYKDGENKGNYLIRADGSKRLLLAAERSKPFDEIAKTNADGTPYVPAKK